MLSRVQHYPQSDEEAWKQFLKKYAKIFINYLLITNETGSTIMNREIITVMSSVTKENTERMNLPNIHNQFFSKFLLQPKPLMTGNTTYFNKHARMPTHS